MRHRPARASTSPPPPAPWPDSFHSWLSSRRNPCGEKRRARRANALPRIERSRPRRPEGSIRAFSVSFDVAAGIKTQGAVRDRPGQCYEGFRPSGDNAQFRRSLRRCTQRFFAAPGRGGGPAERGFEPRSPKVSAKRPATVLAALTVICCPRIARTAVSKPSKAPGTLSPGLSCARPPSTESISIGWAERSKRRFTPARTCGTTPTSAPSRRTTRAGRRWLRKTSIQPQWVTPSGLHAHASSITPFRHRLHSFDGPGPQEGDQLFPRQRRPVAELQRDCVRSFAVARFSAKAGRTHSVMFLHERVESPEARKTARHCHIGDRKACIGEQPFCQKKPVGLSEPDRRSTEFSPEDPPQMPVRHTQPISQSGEPQPIQDAVFDEARGPVGKPSVRLDARITRCKLGTASEAWPETGRFGRRRTREKRAILTLRRFHGADGPAVDAGRRHAGKEAAVEPRVTGEQSLIAYVRIKFHQ